MSNYPDFRVVVLAAGLSERMGKVNKLLLPVDGVPLVRRTSELYVGLGMQVSVVLGHESDRVKEALSGLGVKTVLNADYASGQQSSVKVGLDTLGVSGGIATLIALSDQPLLTSEDITVYCEAFLAGPRDKIMVPYWGQKRGNPVMFPNSIIQRLRGEGKTPACRKFIDSHPNMVTRFPASTVHFIADIDTQQDAKRLLPIVN